MSARIGLTSVVILCALVTPLSGQLVWSDEFDGSTIDRHNWIFDVGNHGFGNGQLEYNTARSENAFVDDGKLTLQAIRESYFGSEFTSARLTTQDRFAFQYGTLEARIRMPNTANGLWPAFWMLGNNFPAIEWPRSGEIDIVEIGGKEGIRTGLQQRHINAALHFGGANDNYQMLDEWYTSPSNLDESFHLYKLTWTPESLEFYLDDQLYASFDISGEDFREFHQPYFLVLNLAVGSWPSRYTGIGNPNEITASLPAAMEVDWIRLYENEHTGVVLGDQLRHSGNFGVFTESDSIQKSLEFASDEQKAFEFSSQAKLLIWNNMTASQIDDPIEGDECWSYQIEPGQWWGMGVFSPTYRNMTDFSDGYLHFAIRTTLQSPIRVGIKSSRGGESFLPLGDQDSEFGFARDGSWQEVRIPLNRFWNIDYATVHQFFMLAGDAVESPVQLDIDHVWWEPSQPRTQPSAPSYGIYTNNPEHQQGGSFQLGKDGDFFIWEQTLVVEEHDQNESSRAMKLSSQGGLNWFGAAFTPDHKIDLSNFDQPSARLSFELRTTSDATFHVGMKSGNIDGVGQKWISFEPGKDPFGFQRDGEWHVVEIPMEQFSREIDLSEVSQLFQLFGDEGPIAEIEIDDICIIVE